MTLGRVQTVLLLLAILGFAGLVYVLGIRPSADTVVSSTTINFDELPAGQFDLASYADQGVTITSNGGSPTVWATSEASSGPNFLVGQSSFDPIEVTFLQPTAVESVALISVGDSTVTVSTYDQADELLETYDVVNTNPDRPDGLNNRDLVTFSASPNAIRLTFVSDGSSNVDGFGIDDLTFSVPSQEVVDEVAPPAEEPSAPVSDETPPTSAPTIEAPPQEVAAPAPVESTPEQPTPVEETAIPPTVVESMPVGPLCNGELATIVGTDGHETLIGTEDRDVIVGLGGVDTIYGRGGNDLLCGGDGHDTVHGEAGDDVVIGDAGNDWLTGGDGADTFDGGDGNDWLYIDGEDRAVQTGSGRDRADVQGEMGVTLNLAVASLEFVTGGPGNDVLDGSGATEFLELHGNGGNDTLIGGSGNDAIHGYDGNDTLVGGGGNDWITTGDGQDSIEAGDGNDWLYIDSDDGVLAGGGRDRADVQGSAGVTLDLAISSLEVVVGGPGDDVFDGSGATDLLELLGHDGDDRLIGGTGNDTLHGYGGNDTVLGGPGNDWLTGGDGQDVIDGEEGSDWLYIGGEDLAIQGGLGNDRADTFGESALTLDVGAASLEFVTGSSADDVLDASSATAAVQLSGRDGADTLLGGSGADSLSGEAGDDELVGASGSDSLYGGDGSDRCAAGEYYHSCETIDEAATPTPSLPTLASPATPPPQVTLRIGDVTQSVGRTPATPPAALPTPSVATVLPSAPSTPTETPTRLPATTDDLPRLPTEVPTPPALPTRPDVNLPANPEGAATQTGDTPSLPTIEAGASATIALDTAATIDVTVALDTVPIATVRPEEASQAITLTIPGDTVAGTHRVSLSSPSWTEPIEFPVMVAGTLTEVLPSDPWSRLQLLFSVGLLAVLATTGIVSTLLPALIRRRRQVNSAGLPDQY